MVDFAKVDTVKIGDKIRISVEMVNQIAGQPLRQSDVVTLEDIWVEEDGSKVLVMSRVEAYEPPKAS